jgi:hypothetical protein
MCFLSQVLRVATCSAIAMKYSFHVTRALAMRDLSVIEGETVTHDSETGA